MDKEFCLKYLRPEHLEGIEGLDEVAQVSGIEAVKTLYKNHETLTIYVQLLSNNEQLIKEIVRDNLKKYQLYELCSKTGVSRKRMKKIVEEVEAEKNLVQK